MGSEALKNSLMMPLLYFKTRYHNNSYASGISTL